MERNTALTAAGFIFGLIALAHLIRIFLHWDITIAGRAIPIWVSFAAFVITFILSVWMFLAKR